MTPPSRDGRDGRDGREAAARREIDFRYAPETSWTLICRPDDSHKTLVSEDGTLLYGFEQTHLGGFSFRRTVGFSAQTGERPLRVRQRTESALVPIVETTIDYPSCRLELRAAGHRAADGRRYDLVAWTLRASDGADGLLAGLHVDLAERDRRHAGAGPGSDHRVFAVRTGELPAYPLFPEEAPPADAAGSAGSRDDGVPGELVLVSGPQPLEVTHPSGFRPASGFRTVPVVVGAGETIRGALVLPLDGRPAGKGPAPALAGEMLHAERAYWQGREDLRVPIRVPDPDLQDMLTAAARNLLQAREPDADGVPVFQVGPTVYRGLWVVDGHFLLEAARYLQLEPCAHGEDPRRAVRPLLARVRPDGSINALADVADPTRHPHTKETGIGIATLVRQWELTGDDRWLAEVWPVVRGGVRHIARLREAAHQLDADSPAYGMMPPAFADGGSAGVRPELTTALWTAAGLGFAARAARALAEHGEHGEHGGEAERIATMARELRADIDRVAERYAGTLSDGHPYLPMILPGSGRHHTLVGVHDPPPEHELRPQTATWALAQAIWPGEVFGPDESVVADYLHLLDRIEREDVPVETGWMPYRALWTYYASFAAHVRLYADQPERAVSLLYGMCNHAAPTRVWREEQALRSEGGASDGRVWGDMPHNWASAELVRLVRHLVVFEVGETLRLLAGVPEDWMAAGGVAVERTPTRFGPVDVSVSDGGIRVSFGESGRLPRRCVLRVPYGEWRLELHVAGGPPAQRELHGPGWVELPLP